MRTKITLALLLLNVALLAVILYTRHEWVAARARDDAARRVLGDDVVGLVSLEIKNPANGAVLRIARDKTTDPWSITAPINWPANEFAVQRIINELSFLKNQTSFQVEDLTKDGQSLSDYGLLPPRLLLSFTRAPVLTGGVSHTTTLGIGDLTKVGNRLYLLSPDGKTVEVVDHTLADSMRVSLEKLRSETIFTIPAYEIRALGLQIPAPAKVDASPPSAEKSGASVSQPSTLNSQLSRVRIRRDGTHWSFEAPIVARASRKASEVAVIALDGLAAGKFFSAAEAPDSRTGLDAPLLRVTLEGNNRRETLVVGRPATAPGKDFTEFYARLEGRDQVFTTSIPNLLFNALRDARETLRDPKVLDFDPADITTIALTPDFSLQRLDAPSGGAASWQIVLHAPNGSKTLPADTTRVTHLLERLALLQAVAHPGKGGATESGFLSDAPTGAQLENWGFNLPARSITLTLAHSAAAGDAVASAPARLTLQLAVSGASEGFVAARVDGQPFVYAVPQDTLDELPLAPRLYRERTLRTLPEGARITGLSLTSDDGAKTLYSHQLAADQTWAAALASEPAAKREAIEAILTQLQTLRAKQFVSDAFTPTTILDGKTVPWKYKLAATLSLSGAAAGQTTTSTLVLGERTGGGVQLAGSEEFNAVFEIEQPFLDALWTLTYGPRDPGPPAKPAGQPAAKVDAPAPAAPKASTSAPAAPTPATPAH